MIAGAETERDLRPRVPLLLPALAAGVGAWLGGFLGLPVAPLSVLLALALLLWFAAARRPALAAAAFYLACFSGGALHLRLPDAFPAPDDLRALPEAKAANPAWEGRIADMPEFLPSRRDPARGRARFTLAVERWKPSLTDGDAAWAPAKGNVSVAIEGTGDGWRLGQRVRVPGPLAVPPPPTAPGGFDTRTFLAERNVFYELRAADSDTERLSPAPALVVRFAQAAEGARRWAAERLRDGVADDPVVPPILAGIVLGQRQGVPLPLLAEFRAAGTYHLFSVNGGDLALLLGLALAALRLAGLVRWRWGWLLAPALLFYALMTGSQPSVIRGLSAAGAVLLAWAMGRPVSPLNLWSLTALAVLAVWPKAALDMGFQFSFVIVLCLIVLAPRFAGWLARPFALDPYVPLRYAAPLQKARARAGLFLGGAVGGCAAAWVGSAGLELAYFHQLCLVAVPANAVAVPLAGLVFVTGLLALGGGLLFHSLSALFNNANWLFVKVLVGYVSLLAHVPHASVYVTPPGPLGDDRDPQFVVAPAGYGTATLLRYRGHAWLVNPADEKGFFYEVDPMRKWMGVGRLDAVFLAQWASAEVSAASLLADLVPVGRFYAPPDMAGGHRPGPWLEALRQRGRAPERLRAGDTLQLAPDLSVTALWPDADDPARLGADRGLVLLFDYRGARLLYAGNPGFGAERRILDRNPDLGTSPLAVLVEGRHPSEPNLSVPWLAALKPSWLLLVGGRSEGPSTFRGDPLAALPPDDGPGTDLLDLARTGAVIVTLRPDGATEARPWMER